MYLYIITLYNVTCNVNYMLHYIKYATYHLFICGNWLTQFWRQSCPTTGRPPDRKEPPTWDVCLHLFLVQMSLYFLVVLHLCLCASFCPSL